MGPVVFIEFMLLLRNIMLSDRLCDLIKSSRSQGHGYWFLYLTKIMSGKPLHCEYVCIRTETNSHYILDFCTDSCFYFASTSNYLLNAIYLSNVSPEQKKKKNSISVHKTLPLFKSLMRTHVWLQILLKLCVPRLTISEEKGRVKEWIYYTMHKNRWIITFDGDRYGDRWRNANIHCKVAWRSPQNNCNRI